MGAKMNDDLRAKNYALMEDYLQALVQALVHTTVDLPGMPSFRTLFVPVELIEQRFYAIDGFRPSSYRYGLPQKETVRSQWLVDVPYWGLSTDYEYAKDYGALKQREQERISWERIRHLYRRTVVFGDPGTGKSWLLKEEALYAAQELLTTTWLSQPHTNEQFLPLYLPLDPLVELYTSGVDDVYDAMSILAQQYYRLPHEIRSWLRSWLPTQPMRFLLDNSDSVDEQDRPQLLQLLRQLDGHRAARIVVASRWEPGLPFPFARSVREPYDLNMPLEELELVGFSSQQAHIALTRWFSAEPERAEHLYQQIIRDPALQSLASLPLYLSWLCWLATIVPPQQELPTTRGALFYQVLEKLLAPHLPPDSSFEDVLNRLEELTWKLAHSSPLGQAYYSSHKLEHQLQAILADHPLGTHEQHVAFVHALLKQHPLFLSEYISDGLEESLMVRFRTPELQDYLLARFLARQPQQTWMPFLFAHSGHTARWRNVFALLAGLVSDCGSFLQAACALAHKDIIWLFWQAHCLIESQTQQASLLDQQKTREVLTRLVQVARHAPIQEQQLAFSLLLRCLGQEIKQTLLQRLQASTSSQADRCAAAWALGQLGDVDVVTVLLHMLEASPSFLQESTHIPFVRVAIVWTLGQLGDPRAIDQLASLVQDAHESLYVRCAAIWSLGQLRASHQISIIIAILLSQQERNFVRCAAAWALGCIADNTAIAPLETIAMDEKEDDSVHTTAQEVLLTFGIPALSALRRLVLSPSVSLEEREILVINLRKIRHTQTDAILRELVSFEQNEKIRVRAIAGLSQSHDPGTIRLLVTLLRQAEEAIEVRAEAAEALRKMSYSELISLLERLLNDGQIPSMLQARLISTLIKMGTLALPVLLRLMRDKDETLSNLARGTLSQEFPLYFSDQQALPQLLTLVRNSAEAPLVRAIAAERLALQGGLLAIEVLSDIFLDQEEALKLRIAVAKALGKSLDAHPLEERQILTLLSMVLRDGQAPEQLRREVAMVVRAPRSEAQDRERPLPELVCEALLIIAIKMSDAAHLEALATLLDASDSVIQHYVIEALVRIEHPRSTELLTKALWTEEGKYIAAEALVARDERSVIEALMQQYEQGNWEDEILTNLVYLLGRRGESLALKPLLQNLRHPSLSDPLLLSGYAAVILGHLGASEAIITLFEALWYREEEAFDDVRTGAAIGLWVMGFSLLLNTVQHLLDEQQ